MNFGKYVKRVLNEMPLLIDYEAYLGRLGDLEYLNEPYEENVNMSTDLMEYSVDTLKRDFIKFNTIKRGHQQFGFYLSKRRNKAIVVLENEFLNESHKDLILKDHYLKVIFELVFKVNSPVSKYLKKYLQVENAYMLSEFRALKLAMICYISLADQGNVIVSDDVHFVGGKELWKSLSKRSDFLGLKIDVMNSETGEIIFQNYHCDKIDDSEIWSVDEENIKSKFVFVMQEI